MREIRELEVQNNLHNIQLPGKIPGQKGAQPPPPADYAYDNPDEANAVPSIASAATTPKPRKFFKSRAGSTAAATQEPVAVEQPVQQPQMSVEETIPTPAPVKTAKAKKSEKKQKATIVQEQQQEIPTPVVHHTAPQPEPAQYIPSVSQDRIRETIPSKRYLARARKVQVNYNEDDVVAVPNTAVSPSLEHHAPIVLRISKVIVCVVLYCLTSQMSQQTFFPAFSHFL